MRRFIIIVLIALLLLAGALFLVVRKPAPLPVTASRFAQSSREERLIATLVAALKEGNLPLLMKITSSELKEKEGVLGLEEKWKECLSYLNGIRGTWKIGRLENYDQVALVEITVENTKEKRSTIFILEREDSNWRVRDFWSFQRKGIDINYFLWGGKRFTTF